MQWLECALSACRVVALGVRLISITQDLGHAPMSLTMRRIMRLFDEYQSRENAKHARRAIKENARQGDWSPDVDESENHVVAATL